MSKKPQNANVKSAKQARRSSSKATAAPCALGSADEMRAIERVRAALANGQRTLWVFQRRAEAETAQAWLAEMGVTARVTPDAFGMPRVITITPGKKTRAAAKRHGWTNE